MKKHLELPDMMSGKQIASLLAAVKRLRWISGRLVTHQGGSHCVLGQLARLSGVQDEWLNRVEQCPDGLEDVVRANDFTKVTCSERNLSKDRAVVNLCSLGDKQYPVGRWIRELLARQKGGR